MIKREVGCRGLQRLHANILCVAHGPFAMLTQPDPRALYTAHGPQPHLTRSAGTDPPYLIYL
jgi:hypothetical protein